MRELAKRIMRSILFRKLEWTEDMVKCCSNCTHNPRKGVGSVGLVCNKWEFDCKTERYGNEK